MNIRSEIWLLIALFFIDIIKNTPSNWELRHKLKEKYVKEKYGYFLAKYGTLAKERSLKEYAISILFSIMIIEDYNRPIAYRKIKDILYPLYSFFSPSARYSSGIMQVRSNMKLSDEESIINALNIINGIITTNPKDEDTDILEKVSQQYSTDGKYYEYLRVVYYQIKESKNH